MKPDTTDNADEIDHPLTEPESLVESEGNDNEHILREQDQSHFETRKEVAGFAIVGITNDADEVLLTSSSDGEWWRLPHARVQHGGDYCVAITSALEEEFTVGIEINRVVHVRRFDAVLEGSPAADLAEHSSDRGELADRSGFTTSFDVLLEATLHVKGEETAEGLKADSDVVVEWFGSVPEGAPGGLPGEDLRRFIG